MQQPTIESQIYGACSCPVLQKSPSGVGNQGLPHIVALWKNFVQSTDTFNRLFDVMLHLKAIGATGRSGRFS